MHSYNAHMRTLTVHIPKHFAKTRQLVTGAGMRDWDEPSAE